MDAGRLALEMALLYKLIAEADGQQLGDVATIEAELNNQNIQVF